MKKLREYYERELGFLQGYAREFAATYPAQATQLGMADGAAGDPHIERLIQATALSNARTARLIDDNDGKLTEALLNVNYPHYLRPFPSTANVRVEAGPAIAAGKVFTLPRGTMMSAHPDNGVTCRFRTTQDVHVTPLQLADVAFHSIFHFPPAMRGHADVVSALSIKIEWGTTDACSPGLPALRLLITGEPSLCATLRDALFLNARGACIELDDGSWRGLETVPLAAAGFGADEALLPAPASAHPAYRLLAEYFAFPAKFDYIDVDWQALARCIPRSCRHLTLHLGLDVQPDSAVSLRLACVSPANLLTGCTPAVNLFARAACPIDMSLAAPDYELAPEGSPASAYDVYSVDKVTVLRESPGTPSITEFRPYYALRHGEQQGRGQYYLVRRDPLRAVTHPGHEMRIALVDRAFDPLASANASVSADLTCTNRDLPNTLRHGRVEGDLMLEQAMGDRSYGCCTALLRPTASATTPGGG
ncbi:type VI secretion system baseplate subunit TssF [Pseudoduganella flava]|uniref:Type VI secretion system baseplate subunit TssF n=1 Tax=Pseudoduganella flava TaxID=871742 RepID=A0ABX6G086_9BURK|nr:type VI secretion system baseplate subunit TssF [Pseudoduganella flava]QGZ42217.1 type VI secretion system baseplate subunit TssF [Pseudoduganella flava]